MRKLLAVIVGALCSLGAHAQKIAIGHMPVTNQVEVVAAERGFYKKHGLDVELKLFQTGLFLGDLFSEIQPAGQYTLVLDKL